jgi:hypothetical protein
MSRVISGAFLAVLLMTGGLAGGCDNSASQSPDGQAAAAPAPLPPSTLSADEEIILYPTTAHFDAQANQWVVAVHGIVYEPEADSVRRAVVVASIRKAADVQDTPGDAERLDRRVRLFLVDNERGKSITVRLGETSYAAGISGPDGHFSAKLLLAADVGARLRSGDRDRVAEVDLSAVLPGTDTRTFAGHIQFVPESGVSVVTDIDDTIKHTDVRDRSATVANTFVREFQVVPGMADLYRQWADRGFAFHYISGSPWQLYLPLSEFLRAEQFPPGSVQLRLFRLKDPSALDMLQSPTKHKLEVLEPLLSAFPQRRFVLVGDSGEQDPEIYAEIARTHRAQVAAICIRNVSGESAENERIRALQPALGDTPLLLFEQAEDVGPWLDSVMSDTNMSQ